MKEGKRVTEEELAGGPLFGKKWFPGPLPKNFIIFERWSAWLVR